MKAANDPQGLERELGVQLPAQYMALLAGYPEELLDGAADFELLANVDRIVELNREMRRLWPESDYDPIPETYLIIGEDGRGNLFAIDLSRGDDSPVFEFEHEENSWHSRAESLDSYTRQLIKLADEEAGH
jgi:hypothetical protein